MAKKRTSACQIFECERNQDSGQRIVTDSGLEGWGELIIEGWADTARAAVEEFAGYIIGKDPFMIEDH